MGAADYVRTYYKVPAKRGMRVTIDGKAGRIVGFDGAHLRVALDGTPAITVNAHPTWHVTYHTANGDEKFV